MKKNNMKCSTDYYIIHKQISSCTNLKENAIDLVGIYIKLPPTTTNEYIKVV